MVEDCSASNGPHIRLLKVDKSNPTQFGRAMGELGIEMIPSYSPQGRGRSERHFDTIQGHLPNELALEGVRDMASANAYLRERFWPDYNRHFAAPAREDGDAFVPLDGVDLDDILCVKEDRVVGHDNCVSYNNRSLQIYGWSCFASLTCPENRSPRDRKICLLQCLRLHRKVEE